MGYETVYAQKVWTDGVGAEWNHQISASLGDEYASHCYPQGSDSKTQYRPKTMYMHLRKVINTDVYDIEKVEFVLVLGTGFKASQNDFPTIRLYIGGQDAPYKVNPIRTTRAYTTLPNHFDFDRYTLSYDFGKLTKEQLNNCVVTISWNRTKVTYPTEIEINRSALRVHIKKKSRWGLYDSISTTTVTTNEQIAWKLTMKNSGGSCDDGKVKLSLPTGLSVVNSVGQGVYDNSTKVWSVRGCNGATFTRTFYLKSSRVAEMKVVALNQSVNRVNSQVSRTLYFTKYVPPFEPITYTFYDTFEKEPYQYFDINIQGYGNNHIGEEYVCYNLATSENVDMYLPLRATAELIDDNINIVELVTDSSIADTDNKLCLHLENVNQDFIANIRVYVYCTDDTVSEITTTQGDNTWTGEFDILPQRGVQFSFDESISRDTTYVTNSVNIGVPNIWTIIADVSRHNFFDEKKEAMEISIEEMIAYIGVIPLSRCHKADVTADSKNSLIENRYLNRAYYGKKGDYSEDIKMTLRIPWYDVATLQGLVEMDKPIPIDTIPNRADGDPLNHRGWAEIYEVTNIKKINDRLYECDVGVKYLSHDINTRFTISEAKKLTEATIKYYLALVHDYNMDLLDIFKLNYYEFWTTLEDSNGDKIGSYNIDPNTTLILNRDLNKHSTYDIVFRNTVPVLMSEDYDGNWEMALKVINKDTSNVLFEHDYNNFKHYDSTNQYAENSADATSKYLNGNNYETLNFEKIGLGYDELSPLIEDMKVATHFNTKETVHITDPTEQFEIFLLDAYNKGIENATVNVRITGSDNFTTTFNCITDLYGRIFFNVDWGNGDYTVTLNFFENEKYRACTYSVGVEVELEYVQYHFTYPSNQQFIGSNSNFVCTLLDDSDNPVSDTILHYSFKDIGGDYEHEETVTTDVDGRATIPIQRMNGSQMIRVNFKGYSDNGTVYQPVQFEEQINVTNLNLSELIVEADNLELVQGDSEKQYSVIVKNKETGSVVQDLNMDFYLYNNDESYHLNATTNSYGVASVPIYLKGGAWKIDVYFKGDETYNPYIITRNVIIFNFVQYESYIETENLTLNENRILDGSQKYYTVKLLDENSNVVIDEPISIKIYDYKGINSSAENPYVDAIFRTDENGKIEVPFISHDEQVIMHSTYYGSVTHKPCDYVDVVTFETIPTKTVQSLSKVTETVIDYHTGEEAEEDYIKLTIGSTLQNSWDSDACIVNSLDNVRMTSAYPKINDLAEVISGEYDSYVLNNNTLPKGEHKVTVLKKGDANNYSICRTFTIRTVNDERPNFAYWCSMQGILDDNWQLEQLNLVNTGKVGDYAHIRFNSNVWLPTGTLVTIKSGYVNSSSYDAEYKTITKDYYDEDGNLKTYFEVYGVLTSEQTWRFDFEDTYNCKAVWYEHEIASASSTKNNVTVSQTGFAYNNETHQDLAITVARGNDVIYYTNNYYIIKAFNVETNEELYYYSFINDNLKPSEISFDLTTTSNDDPNWKLEIFLNSTDTDKCGYYTTTGLITTSTVINTDTILPIFADGNSYIEDGTSQLTFGDNGFSFETQGGK